MNNKKKFWKNKKVLITGHTGFKGGWLTVILHLLGAKLYGYALNPVGKYNFFNLVKIKKCFKKDKRADIINFLKLKKFIDHIKPEIVFHLAAQSSVIESFKNPQKTIFTNVLGTANILEIVKNSDTIKSLVIITTDKVYQNYKIKKYFSENSLLGGDDVYSGSKACCEILSNSYNKSFLSSKNCNISTVRAGNCFGGGDWTEDRIVKDTLESFSQNKKLTLRNPEANRPWQHVIEPLIGYLILAEKLFSKKGKKYVGAWNFGPNTKQNMKVLNLARLIKSTIKSNSKIIIKKKDKRFHTKKHKVFESKYLNIDSSKAFKFLGWRSKLSIKNAVELTVEWYNAFLSKKNLLKLTSEQIKNYLSLKY
jgi:CDP-glucose 4,6-dehydratase